MRALQILFLAAFPALGLGLPLLLPNGPARHSVAKVHYVLSPPNKRDGSREGDARILRTARHLELRWGTHRLGLALDPHGYPGTFFAPPELAQKDLDLGMRVLFALCFSRELKGEEKGADLLGPTQVQWSDPYVARTERGLYTSGFGARGELLWTEGQDILTGDSHRLELTGWTVEPGGIDLAGLTPTARKNN